MPTRLILTLLALLLTTSSFAADAEFAKPGSDTAADRSQSTAKQAGLFGFLRTMLALNEPQQGQIKPLLDDLAAFQRQIKADASLSSDQQTQRLNEAFDATKQAMHVYLSEEQWQKLAKLQLQFRAEKTQ